MTATESPRPLRVRQRLGKYRIEGRLGSGAFANVYKAMDTIEGIRVALKIPHDSLMTEEMLKAFRSEVRIMARMEHNNILSLKDANWIDERFVLVFPLGERTLEQRLCNRMSQTTALGLSEQMLDAVAYAHRARIVHCDIKPENLILFSNNRLRLTDFGIAKIAHKTLHGSGTGTVGYMAPEQAMGKPSVRSDVFSVGLIMYRLLSGRWPEWPFEWPLPGYDRLRGKVHPDLIAFLRRAIELKPNKRFKDGDDMLRAYNRIRRRVYRHITVQRTARRAKRQRKRAA